MEKKLFAVYLGGRAARCNTELHDVAFVTGVKIEDTYEKLMDLWFGTPKGLHIDSWMDLTLVDGYRLSLSEDPGEQEKKLFFINLGAYLPGQFTEMHACTFLVSEDKKEIMGRAKQDLLKGMTFVHTDDLFDIDDCIEITKVDNCSVKLVKTDEAPVLIPNNGYHIIPKHIVADYLKRNPHRA